MSKILRRFTNNVIAELSEKNGIIRKYHDPMIEGVRWSEKYSESLERFFLKVPEFITSFVATLALFTLGATLKGEWVIILVHIFKQSTFGVDDTICNATSSHYPLSEDTMFCNASKALPVALTWENLKMKNISYYFIASILVSYVVYFSIGGFLHWYFYVRRRDSAKEWKIQPNKWLSPEMELHEIMIGTLALMCTGAFSGLLACYIANGNPSRMYYQFDEYGWFWIFLQIPVLFIYQDYTTYILHRLYHTPYLYKKFHKLHHKYKQPTAFSVTAIHPVEILHVQLTMCLPLFVIPLHWIPFYIVAFYTYYHGIIDHSGINFKAQWWQPWQPDADFHDKHHEFFHVNFGFNIKIWDKIHGTEMKKNRKYDETKYHDSSLLKVFGVKSSSDEVTTGKEVIADHNGNVPAEKLPGKNKNLEKESGT